MSASRHVERSHMGVREVPATFGRKEVLPDPAWQWEFSVSLREGHSERELHALYSRHRDGESSFDYLMRKILVRAMARRAGHGLEVGPGVVLKHPETMEFGDAVFIGAQAMIQGRHDGRCTIGSRVWIGPQAYLDARSLEVQDYVGWGPGAKLLGSTHTGDPVDSPIIATSLEIKPVFIAEGADVGMNASVLPGVRIGANSIVGAGAVVTEDVPDFAIVAGVPARIVRSRCEP